MKKVMIMLALVVVATMTQAASFKWTSTGTTTNNKKFYGSDGNAVTSELQAYLFDAATVSQADLLAGLKNGDAITKYSSVATGTVGSDSKFTAVDNISYGTAGTTYNFYMAVVDGGQVMFSKVIPGEAQAADTTTIAFSNPGTWTKAEGAWQSTSDTPEPTSGLLLLVGGAMLALRRKQK